METVIYILEDNSESVVVPVAITATGILNLNNTAFFALSTNQSGS